MKSSFWDKFSQLPEVQGRSQNQLARELGVAPNTIGAWRRMGVWPDPATFEKIKRLTDKSQGWFLREKVLGIDAKRTVAILKTIREKIKNAGAKLYPIQEDREQALESLDQAIELINEMHESD
jgi:transcriptional regulator with XRE-family HTH domain